MRQPPLSLGRYRRSRTESGVWGSPPRGRRSVPFREEIEIDVAVAASPSFTRTCGVSSSAPALSPRRAWPKTRPAPPSAGCRAIDDAHRAPARQRLVHEARCPRGNLRSVAEISARAGNARTAPAMIRTSHAMGLIGRRLRRVLLEVFLGPSASAAGFLLRGLPRLGARRPADVRRSEADPPARACPAQKRLASSCSPLDRNSSRGVRRGVARAVALLLRFDALGDDADAELACEAQDRAHGCRTFGSVRAASMNFA